MRRNHEYFSMGREKFRRRNYTYRYLILVASRLAGVIVSSIVVCAVSQWYTLNIMSAITDYVAAHLVSKGIKKSLKKCTIVKKLNYIDSKGTTSKAN